MEHSTIYCSKVVACVFKYRDVNWLLYRTKPHIWWFVSSVTTEHSSAIKRASAQNLHVSTSLARNEWERWWKQKNACNDVEPDANKFYCFSCPSTIHRMHVIQTICIVHTKPSLVKPYRRMRTHLLIIRICCSSFVEFVFPLPSEWHMEKIRGHSWSIDVAGKLSLHTNDNWLRALTWFMLPELLRSCFGVLFHLIYVIRLR